MWKVVTSSKFSVLQGVHGALPQPLVLDRVRRVLFGLLDRTRQPTVAFDGWVMHDVRRSLVVSSTIHVR